MTGPLIVLDPETEPIMSGNVGEERSPPPLPETDSLWYMSQSKVNTTSITDQFLEVERLIGYLL